MIALLTRMLFTTLVCCGLSTAGAVMVGHRRTGMSAAYQVDGQPCAIQLIDTDRPKENYTLVSKPPFCLRHSAWSPDRRYAALTPYPRGALSVAVGRAGRDWGQVYDIAGVIAIQSSLVWSPDSSQMAFMTDSRDVTVIGAIRMVNGVPETPRFFSITGTQRIPDSSLAWSPDGSSVAFGANSLPRQQGGQELYILNVNDGSIHRLTTNAYLDDSPSWSPDGKQLVFTSAVAGYNELYVIDVATGERRRLTYYTIGYTPNWSPDGKLIAFESNLNYNFDLYVIGSNGYKLRRLTFSHLANGLYPIWLH
jgi:Tol biopolymer transport system component